MLDPACGSGNFLYVTLQKLKDLEKEAILFAMERGFPSFFPMVGPWQLYGIEINPYAFELAQMTVWIGYLQWTKANGFGVPPEPILKPMDANFRCIDAILDLSDPDNPKEPEWPEADFIIGNPPFLGGNRIRQGLGDLYVNGLFRVYRDRVRPFSDICCYWFERARKCIEERAGVVRSGLLATQAIRGEASRQVLARIKESGGIFFAESDRPWILEGAAVHVSMIGFDDGTENIRMLNSKPVIQINSNLTAATDVTQAKRLASNIGKCFMGPSAKGPFDIPEKLALQFLREPTVSGSPVSDVVRPVYSAIDLTSRGRHFWTVDFGCMPLESAASYEGPFALLKERVYPIRSAKRGAAQLENWWQYARPRPALRSLLRDRQSFIATPAHAKHRLFVRCGCEILCNQGTLVFPTDDDYLLGIMHSRLHEVWARAHGTQVRERESGFRYTPTTCFETFPFPSPTESQKQVITGATVSLINLRNSWLHPPEWTREEIIEFPGSLDGPWSHFVHEADARGVGIVRYPRIIPKDDQCAQKLQARTLTNLYNQRPAWLDLAHRKLDNAVFVAYGWPPNINKARLLSGSWN